MPARYAADPNASRGRLHPQPASAHRDAFSRDRDRIVHSVAFRRLNGKTQVFAAPNGDHTRVRLTHTLEVAGIARTVARALQLNADLAEAIALGHDLGHPPFGHAGEGALNVALAHAGGWEHNGHTLRTVTALETPYPAWPGLNLSWETLEGLAKHNGPVAGPGWALAAADAEWPLDLARWPSLEAQVAALADDIAYDCHDLDDGLAAGIVPLDAVLAQPFLAACHATARALFPSAPEDRLQGAFVREAQGLLVGDLVRESRARIAAAAPANADAARAAGPLVGFSVAMAATERALKAFLHAHLYHHPDVVRRTRPAAACVSALFERFRHDPAALPIAWRAGLPDADPGRARRIADYIAGMTDRFAVALYERLIGPSPLAANGF